VPSSLPGEAAEVEITRDHGSWAEGVVISVLDPSPHRVLPACRYFGRCGGCQLQHASYEFQLELKARMVREALERIGKVRAPHVLPVMASPLPLAYRNRIAVHSDGRAIGFHEAASRRIVDVEQCAIASGEINRQLQKLRARKSRWKGTRVLREAAPFRGFRQVNDAAAALLAREVLRRLEPGGGHLIEAFCGGGFFTAPAAALFQKVTAIEWSREAARAARRACPRHTGIIEGDAALILPGLLKSEPPDVLLADPPTEGLDIRITSAISENPPPLFLYVSCNPATFARDIRRLSEKFQLAEVQPVDMFPQTAQIECVGVLKPITPARGKTSP
ncbi:MAG: hypothetical protein N2322_03030, partial [Terrimicrobiaceae bacterium]|nr:hypothetical protein [Terrimicrobiaceae bacterium]